MKIQMKKTYEKPELKVITCAPMEMLCQSVVGGDDGGDGWVGEDDALAPPSHQEWGDIWK